MTKQKATKKAKKVEKEQSLDERVLLGRVGVDSGQLIVCDPAYIDSEWKHPHKDENGDNNDNELVEILGFHKYRDTETGAIFDHPMMWNAEYRNGLTYNQALESGLIEKYTSKEIQEKAKEFSYIGCCANTLYKEGGQLHYKRGHEGAGVVFSSGLSDGVYDVFATIGEVEGWGRRVKKVEIMLVEDEYVEKLNEHFGK